MDWDDFFEEYVYGWMFHDIKIALENEANYLAALGLSVYIEVLGAIKRSKWDDSGSTEWNTFLRDMNPKYSMMIKKTNLYNRIRCGLAHAYWIKGVSNIQLERDTQNQGIIYDKKTNRIQISLVDLFDEFKKAAKNLHTEVKKKNESPPSWTPGISGTVTTVILGKMQSSKKKK